MASIKAEDFEFSSDSPIYDFSAGFESIPMTYMPESDSYSVYSYGSSPTGSLASSPNESMAVDGPYGPPAQLSNSHRQARFLQRNQWPTGDPSQRHTMHQNPRSFTPLSSYGSSFERGEEQAQGGPQGDQGVLQYPQTTFQLRANGTRHVLPVGMDASSSSAETMMVESPVSQMASQLNDVQGVQLVIETHPPVEVRTRTPSEKRNFSCSIQVLGDYKAIGGKFVSVELQYSPNAQRGPGDDEVPKQTILGGTKVVMIKANGTAVFDNLSMSEASTKHKEKEFCLRFTLVDKTGAKLPVAARTTSFYAFSNTKVLARRRDISLRTLSKSFGPYQGGETMHVIGAPFIRGPALKLIFRTPHGDAVANNLELYSETVLFFTLPAYPAQTMPGESEPLEVKAQVLVTNDGRNFSNPIDFLYVSSRRSTMRSYL